MCLNQHRGGLQSKYISNIEDIPIIIMLCLLHIRLESGKNAPNALAVARYTKIIFSFLLYKRNIYKRKEKKSKCAIASHWRLLFVGACSCEFLRKNLRVSPFLFLDIFGHASLFHFENDDIFFSFCFKLNIIKWSKSGIDTQFWK